MSKVSSNVLDFVPKRLNDAFTDASQFVLEAFPHDEVTQLLEKNYPPLDVTDTLLASVLTFALTVIVCTFVQYEVRLVLKKLIRLRFFNQNNFIRIVMLVFPSIHSEGGMKVMTSTGRKARRKSNLEAKRKREGPFR